MKTKKEDTTAQSVRNKYTRTVLVKIVDARYGESVQTDAKPDPQADNERDIQLRDRKGRILFCGSIG
jgi:hypothetical protein